jgi:putative membrane protein
MMDGWDMNGWGWGWMTLMMVVGVLLVALLVVTLLRGSVPGPRSDDRPDAEQVLAQRLARGEIDEDEYRRRRGALRSTNGTPAAEPGAGQRTEGTP